MGEFISRVALLPVALRSGEVRDYVLGLGDLVGIEEATHRLFGDVARPIVPCLLRDYVLGLGVSHRRSDSSALSTTAHCTVLVQSANSPERVLASLRRRSLCCASIIAAGVAPPFRRDEGNHRLPPLRLHREPRRESRAARHPCSRSPAAGLPKKIDGSVRVGSLALAGRTARLPRCSGHDRAGSLKSGVSRLPGTTPAMRPPDRLGGLAARGPLPSGTPSTRIRGAGRRTRGPRIRPGGVAPPPGGP